MGILTVCVPAKAGNRFFTGSIGLEEPVFQKPDHRLQDSSGMFLGNLVLHNAVEKFSFVLKGQLQLRHGLPYEKEDKFSAMVEHPLWNGFVIYGGAEHRYSQISTRYLMGIRLDFKSAKF